MKILHSKPPEWLQTACREQFGAEYEKGMMFTLGDTVYSKDPIPEDWQVHEAVHSKQQLAIGPEKWWERYFKDRIFRMGQELEAYKAQYTFIESYCKDRNTLDKACRELARQLATIYGLNINQMQAYKLIKSK